MKLEWIRCPICGSKTRDRIRSDTIKKNGAHRKMPTFQIEMQALPTLNFRYFTCLFDKGHISGRRPRKSR
ncbi:MAG: hypothetical protein HFH38_15985 [Lachnospiraceae bacterium]|jgi:hypothetical protein|nr:hypothetical protein [Lachnospiraceae bacterium]